ncbi:MAG: DALR domain-containing protein [Trebonia sp.]
MRRIREAARRLKKRGSPPWSRRIRERFFGALADDLGTPRALAAVFELVAEANRSPAGRRS